MALNDGTTPLVPNFSISGAALTALLHRCAANTGDRDGSSRPRLPPPCAPATLSDYDDLAASPPAPTLSISISSHCSLSHPSYLSDPLSLFQPQSFADISTAVDFFSSRRRTVLRPSMQEVALSHSISKTLTTSHPLLIIFLSPSASPDFSTHTYDYRAFLLLASRLISASLTVINVAPQLQGPVPHLLPTISHVLPTHSSALVRSRSHTQCWIGEQKEVDEMWMDLGSGGCKGSWALPKSKSWRWVTCMQAVAELAKFNTKGHIKDFIHEMIVISNKFPSTSS
ncbi:unnamed protein product [Urochloa humidicola]